MSPRSTSRTQPSAIRRAQILAAAKQCFRKAGFHATTVAEIAKAARVSVGLIYRFFPSKESLIQGIVQEDANRLIEILQKILDQHPDEMLATAISSQGFLEILFDEQRATLMLEIVAEASRNRKIRAIAFDKSNQKKITELFGHRLRALRPPGWSPEETTARLRLAHALLSGIVINNIFVSGMSTPIFLDLLTQMIRQLLFTGPETGRPR